MYLQFFFARARCVFASSVGKRAVRPQFDASSCPCCADDYWPNTAHPYTVVIALGLYCTTLSRFIESPSMERNWLHVAARPHMQGCVFGLPKNYCTVWFSCPKTAVQPRRINAVHATYMSEPDATSSHKWAHKAEHRLLHKSMTSLGTCCYSWLQSWYRP